MERPRNNSDKPLGLLRKIGNFITHARLRPISLMDLSAEHSSRPARLVVDVMSPPRYVPSEITSAEQLDAEFERYWNLAVEGQARRAQENQSDRQD